MKKNLFKTSIVAGALLAFGFLMVSNTSNVAEAAVTWSWTADVLLTVEAGQLTIWITWWDETGLVLGETTVSNSTGVLSGDFGADNFWLSDQKWHESGYYTTLSVTDLIWENNPAHVIAAENVYLHSTAVNLVEWEANAGVTIWLSSEYTQMSSGTVVNYFRRAAGTEYAWILGVYWDDLYVKVDVPPHTLADTYKWTITYTLYDLSAE